MSSSKTLDRLEQQSAEFDAAQAFADQVRRHSMTAVVEDDYPAVRHAYESALATLLRAMRDNGRFDVGNRYGLAPIDTAPRRPADGFAHLRDANAARQKEWDHKSQITLAYRGNELAGEVGEACNVIKKLERERLGIRGSRATTAMLAEELADVIICTDLIAMSAGIDLDTAVAEKFNATSAAVGLATRMRVPV